MIKSREFIEAQLDRLLPKSNIEPKSLHRAMRYSIFSGGKRLRPIIVIESCRAAGGSVSDAIDAACAIEMIHTYSLIHDDLPSMDNDDYRRGRLSCHKRFGEATAILAGDGLLTQAFYVLAGIKKMSRLRMALKELSLAIGSLGMVGGQEADLRKKKRRDSRDLKFIAENKTAALFRASAALGAILGGGKKREIKALSSFGRLFGTAFQLADDAFDNDGYARIIGKNNTEILAREFMEKAKAQLILLGKKAYRLREITDETFKQYK